MALGDLYRTIARAWPRFRARVRMVSGMTSEQSARSSSWFNGRTRIVTALSIVVVGVAGATAVGANIGILDSASDGQVGDASVTEDFGAPSTQVVDVYLPDPAGDVRRFTVDVAGTVAVMVTKTAVRMDEIGPMPGWSWTLVQSSSTSLRITFTNGSRKLEFTAAVGPDGSLSTAVVEPSTEATSSAEEEDEDDGYDWYEEFEGSYDDD